MSNAYCFNNFEAVTFINALFELFECCETGIVLELDSPADEGLLCGFIGAIIVYKFLTNDITYPLSSHVFGLSKDTIEKANSKTSSSKINPKHLFNASLQIRLLWVLSILSAVRLHTDRQISSTTSLTLKIG